MGNKFSDKHRIATYDCTPQEALSPVMILNWFQEVAQEHCEAVKLGFSFNASRELAWFVVKYDIAFIKYPCYGQEVILETEAFAFDRFAAQRKFKLYSMDGELLVEADSEWMLLSRENGKVVRLSTVPELEAFGAGTKSDFSLRRLPKLDGDPEQVKQFQIRYLDIDYNGHVNNVKYLAWAIETLPAEVVQDQEIAALKIIYKEQAFYGGNITASAIQTGPFCWRIDINENDRILTQLEMTMRPITEEMRRERKC
ncbi:MAG: acyl-[acyl-carrier-protein] thioesterase [Eubacteriaceae bacterium]|jgi:medium-chain acyl-[acyl-carrier-protein] hydrolase